MEYIEEGAIQIARRITSSDIFLNKPDKWLKIWLYILTEVNHKENKNEDGYRRGEKFFKSEWIQDKCKATPDQIKKCVAFLKVSTMISTKRSTRGMFVKVLNYDKYQTLDNYKAPQKALIQAQEKHQESTTINKNEKNEKKNTEVKTSILKKIFSTPELLEEKRKEVFEKCINKIATDKNVSVQDLNVDYIESELYVKWNKFVSYWTAISEGGKLMACEKVKTFNIYLRFNTWITNKFN